LWIREVDDLLAARIADPRLADVPLGGIVQSNAREPLATRWRSSGRRRPNASSVARRPAPVMLRQIG
jgi:hypothetical protein